MPVTTQSGRSAAKALAQQGFPGHGPVDLPLTSGSYLAHSNQLTIFSRGSSSSRSGAKAWRHHARLIGRLLGATVARARRGRRSR